MNPTRAAREQLRQELLGLAQDLRALQDLGILERLDRIKALIETVGEAAPQWVPPHIEREPWHQQRVAQGAPPHLVNAGQYFAVCLDDLQGAFEETLERLRDVAPAFRLEFSDQIIPENAETWLRRQLERLGKEEGD